MWLVFVSERAQHTDLQRLIDCLLGSRVVPALVELDVCSSVDTQALPHFAEVWGHGAHAKGIRDGTTHNGQPKQIVELQPDSTSLREPVTARRYILSWDEDV